MGNNWKHPGFFEKNDGQIVLCEFGPHCKRDIDESVVALRVMTVRTQRSTILDYAQVAQHNRKSSALMGMGEMVYDVKVNE